MNTSELPPSVVEPAVSQAAQLTPSPAAPTAHPLMQGYIMLVIAVLANGTRFHTDQLALKGETGCTPYVLLFISSLTAAVGFLITAIVWRVLGWKAAGLQQTTPGNIIITLRKHGWILATAAAAGTAGGFCYAYSLNWYGPETTAFLNNLTFVFVMCGGIIAGERLRRAEFLCIAFILIGAFVFSYKGNAIQWGALGIMAIVCLMNACKQLLTSRTVGKATLTGTMTTMLLIMALWSLLAACATDTLRMPNNTAILFAVISAVMSSMIGMSLLYAGYQRIGVARGGPVDAMRPLAAMLVGLSLGTPLPHGYQIVGGTLVLIGSFALARTIRRNARKPAGIK